MNSFESVVSSQWSVASGDGRALKTTDYELLTTDLNQDA